jgi:hypothetical protein
VIPRIILVSRLASRRSSTTSFVTIADDEIPTAPPITSASRDPHPSENPSAKPPPTFRRR